MKQYNYRNTYYAYTTEAIIAVIFHWSNQPLAGFNLIQLASFLSLTSCSTPVQQSRYFSLTNYKDGMQDILLGIEKNN